MELSSPSNPEVDASAQPSRRKSGRVPKQTDFLSPTASAKRKRNEDVDANEDENDDADMNDASDNDQEDEPDEEELREQRRKQGAKGTSKAKPPAKKQKPNGISAGAHATLVRRPAKKATKAKKGRIASAEEVGGLYGSVFAGDERLDSVAAGWLQRFAAHESNALAELVNFVLRCAGCEIEVNGHDIEDPDHAPEKLNDIQEEFQAKALSDYPLISRSKGTATFRKTLTSFVNTFILTIAAKDILTGQPELIENIQIWIGTMSSAPNRPLRHTATLVSLEIISALTELGRSANESRSKITRQAEGEKKNKKVNQTRINSLEQSAEEAGQRAIQINSIIKDWFEVVFVHRYRDVDARIRVDCVTYLSEWIWTYPDQFLDGQHLRYLGWVLSDEATHTRQQVVRDMQKLYEDDAKTGGLRQFTDRFRPRMVEMATRDGDLSVRCSSIELLNILRDKGLLEPDDIDTVGRLVFDSEARVRKAVAPFFAAIVEDVYQAKNDEFENLEEEALEDFKQNEDDDDYEGYKLNWIRFKSVVELLRSYDNEDEAARPIDIEAQAFNETTEDIHSRMSLATEAFFDQIPCLSKWDSLAGYLLKDINEHETISDTSDVTAYIDNACLLAPQEQTILLDVLNVSVKHTLTAVTTDGGVVSKKTKKTKRELEDLAEAQEAAAQRLASLIPRLLKKFGESPESASAVLRLETVIKLDVFAQLREESTTFANLIEDIRRQFMSHEAASVISSAKRALLHARNNDELQEVTDGKLSMLWDDTTLTLARLCGSQDSTIRGNLHVSVVNAISTTVLRIANLASISSCIEPLETTHNVSPASAKRKPNKPSQASDASKSITPITCLLDIIRRGVLTPDTTTDDPTLNTAEDQLVTHALTALNFYLQWHTLALRTKLPHVATSRQDLHATYTSLQTTLRALITSRHAADPLRTQAAGALLESATLFSTLRNVGPDAREALDLPSSARLPSQARAAALAVFVSVERDYSRKAGKTLLDPAEETAEDAAESQRQEQEALEAEPESSDEESEAVEGEGDDEVAQARVQARRNKKAKSTLLAEHSLCALAGKFVLAIVGGCIDDGGETHKRILRNRGRLGKNYAEVVGVLERKEEKRTKTGAAGPGAGVKGAARPQSRAPVEEEEMLEVEDDPIEEDGEEDLRRRELVEGGVDEGEGGEGAGDERVDEEPESVLGD